MAEANQWSDYMETPLKCDLYQNVSSEFFFGILELDQESVMSTLECSPNHTGLIVAYNTKQNNAFAKSLK